MMSVPYKESEILLLFIKESIQHTENTLKL